MPPFSIAGAGKRHVDDARGAAESDQEALVPTRVAIRPFIWAGGDQRPRGDGVFAP